jgi:NADH-quinone oxidoreductase E subunit
MLNANVMNGIDRLREKYQNPQSLLLPALYLAQKEYGWLSPEVLSDVSVALNVPKATVKGVSSFYAMFIHKPMGRHLIQLCTNVACMVMGAERLVDILKERYGLQPNSTTADGRFSLVIMECIGSCGTAPAMLVNADFHDNLTEENIGKILENYK